MKKLFLALLAFGAFLTSNGQQWNYSASPGTIASTSARSGDIWLQSTGSPTTLCTGCTLSKFNFGNWSLINNATTTSLTTNILPGEIDLQPTGTTITTVNKATLTNSAFSIRAAGNMIPNVGYGTTVSMDLVNGFKIYAQVNGNYASSTLNQGTLSLVSSTTSNVLSISNISNSNTFTVDGNTMNLITSGAMTIGTTVTPKTLTLNGSLVNTGTAVFGTTTTPSSVTVNGTIGIGTTNATLLSTYKLAVNGGIVATAMDINGTVPASDYVFEKDYKLRTLTETEAYVNEHKHLPEVPSAQKFKTNGYSVGKFDDIMLKKVEELTLYMIELQKQNEVLKAKVESLEKAVR